MVFEDREAFKEAFRHNLFLSSTERELLIEEEKRLKEKSKQRTIKAKEIEDVI